MNSALDECAVINASPLIFLKQRGWIPAARPVLEDLVRGGMYLSRRVLDEALRRVGE